MTPKAASGDGDGDGERERWPRLLVFLGGHMALGLAFGVAVAALLLILDIAGLKTLIATTSEPVVALILFYSFNALTFSSVAMGIAVMTLPMGEVCDMRDPDHRERD